MDFTTEQPLQNKRSPKYLYGIGAGFLAAILVAPIHRLVVIMTYSDGYYSDWPILLLMIGLAVGLAMAVVSEGALNIGMAILAGLFTLASFLFSEYLVVHFLLNQYILEEGLGGKALLIQPLDVVLAWMIDYFLKNPLSLLMGLVGVGGAVVLCLRQNSQPTPRPISEPVNSDDAQPVDFSKLQGQRLESPVAYDAPPVSRIKVPEGAYDLGSPIQEYRPTLFRIGLLASLTTMMSASAVAIIIVTKGAAFWVMFPFFLIPFGGLAIYSLVLFFTTRGNRVILFEDGISITQKGRKHQFRWDEISRVYHDRPVNQQASACYANFFRLCHRNGTEVILKQHYKKFEELGQTIHQSVTKYQIPQAIKTLKNDKSLDFDTMHITQEGIHFHDDIESWIPWSDVARVSITLGFIRADTKRSPLTGYRVPMSKTANPLLFLTLVEKVTALRLQSDI